MSGIAPSSEIIQECCYGQLRSSKEFSEASEIFKSDNMDDSTKVKANTAAIKLLQDGKHKPVARKLGESLVKVASALNATVSRGSPSEVDSQSLSDLEEKMYTAMLGAIQSYDSEAKGQFNTDFQNYVQSYHSEVLATEMGELKAVVPALDAVVPALDVALYCDALRACANRDRGSELSARFNEGGNLRARFDERLTRLTSGEDRLPHFQTGFSSEEAYQQLEAFLQEMAGNEPLSEAQRAAYTQAYIDYPQIRDDTVRFSGELFTLPKTGQEYVNKTLSNPRLEKVTLLSEANRARSLDDIIKMDTLFRSEGPQYPLIQLIPLKAERLLKHEILSHLMLDRGVRDDGFETLLPQIVRAVNQKDPDWEKTIEEYRSKVETLTREDLVTQPPATVQEFEDRCCQLLGLKPDDPNGMNLDLVLHNLDREAFVALLNGEASQKRAEALNVLSMRLGDCAARLMSKQRLTEFIDQGLLEDIGDLPPKIPQVPLSERRVFTVNGGAASGKSTATRKVLGEGANVPGMPERKHIATVTRDSLMTSLLDPSTLAKEDVDYFAAFAYDEACLIAGDVETTRRAREKATGKGPHIFYDQVVPKLDVYTLGVNSAQMDGVVVNMPVETSVLLAQFRGEKEQRYAGRWCILNSHKIQVKQQLGVIEGLRNEEENGKSLDHVHCKIVTKVHKDLDPYPTVDFNFKKKCLEVNSSGYFYDFLRKDSIELGAETMSALYPYPEMSDKKYAELFMGFANQFETVALTYLDADFQEQVLEVNKNGFEDLQAEMGEEGNDLSASVQRQRQNQFKALSNARSFIDQARVAKQENNSEQFAKVLAKAEKEIEEYRSTYGSSDVVAWNIASDLEKQVENLSQE